MSVFDGNNQCQIKHNWISLFYKRIKILKGDRTVTKISHQNKGLKYETLMDQLFSWIKW